MYYHSTDRVLPKTFVVAKKSSFRTKETLARDYDIKSFSGGLFVSDLPEKTYGKFIYRVISKVEPLMLDNGKFIYPVGTRVSVIRI